jgi:transcriptional regulator with XRE-family HTH domain
MSNAGKLIRNKRTEQGLSINVLAATVGCSTEHLRTIERSNLYGTPYTLCAIAAVLGIDEDVMYETYLQDVREDAILVWRIGAKARRSVTNKGVEIRSKVA